MKKSRDRLNRDEAESLTRDLKRCWHELGQLHLRLYNGIDRNEPVYMTKPQVKDAIFSIAGRLMEISEKYTQPTEKKPD